MKNTIKTLIIFISTSLSLSAVSHTITDDFENGLNGWSAFGVPQIPIQKYPSWSNNHALKFTAEGWSYIYKIYHFGTQNANKDIIVHSEYFREGSWYWKNNYLLIWTTHSYGYTWLNVPRDAQRTYTRFGLDVAVFRGTFTTDAQGDFLFRIKKDTIDRYNSILLLDEIKITMDNYTPPPTPPPTPQPTPQPTPPPANNGDTGAFDAWDVGRGDTTGNDTLDDKHISTKIANRSFSLKLARVNADASNIINNGGSGWFNYAVYNGTTQVSNQYTSKINSANAIVTNNLIVDEAYKDVRLGFTFCADYTYDTNSGKYEYTDIKQMRECANKPLVSCRTVGRNKGMRTCYSSDHFAIRPEKFVIPTNNGASGGEDLKLLKAGQSYNLTVKAGDTPYLSYPDSVINSYGYSIGKNDITFSHTLRLYNGTEDSKGEMSGTVTLNKNKFRMTDGSNDASSPLKVKFTDVGKMKITAVDKKWAAIDKLDTPQDCTSTTFTNASGISIPNLEPAYICGEADLTFIPYHFKITNLTASHNNADSNLTYLTANDDLNMSVKVSFQILSENKQGNTTLNFTTGDPSLGSNMFENPVAITLQVPTKNINKADINLTSVKKDMPTPAFLNFINGSKTIASTSTNQAEQIRFNYNKVPGTFNNPIEIRFDDLSISVNSVYGSSGGAQARVTGSESGDTLDNMTIYDPRVVTAQESYITKNGSQTTPLFVQVFCNENPIRCKSYGLYNSTQDSNWYVLENHTPLSDGNIVLSVDQSATLSAPLSIVSGADINLTVTAASQPSIVTLSLDPTLTDNWLMSGTNDLCTIKFLSTPPTTPPIIPSSSGNSKWSGHGTLGLTLDLNASSRVLQRVGW